MPPSPLPQKVSAPDVTTLRAMAAAVVGTAPAPTVGSYRPRFLPPPPVAAPPPPPAVMAAMPLPMTESAPPVVVPATPAPAPLVAPAPAPPPAAASPARRSFFTRRTGTLAAAGLAAAALALVLSRGERPAGNAPPMLASVRVPQAQTPLPAPAPAPIAPIKAATPAPVEPEPQPEPQPAPTATASAPAPETPPAKKPAAETGRQPRPRSTPRKVALARPAPTPAPASADAPPPAVSAGTDSELDKLVQTALAGKEKRGEARPEEPEALPSLTRDEIQASMKPLRPRIKECYKQFGQRGLALVNVKVGDKGQVASTRVEGTFAGSPTGACVESAVKTVRFPQSAGMTFRYPFPVR